MDLQTVEPGNSGRAIFPAMSSLFPSPPPVLADVVGQREIAEVRAAMSIAKQFPRNQAQAMDRILIACQRPTLAESALYSYARGGTDITGPSIRLAEALAQQWGNIQFGIRELDQRHGESTVEAYAWDLETNTRQTKVFQVKHQRYTRKGSYGLEDPRDIYELVANQGARRLRACILGIIPGDVVEAAVQECESTLRAKANTSPDAVKKMVEAFDAFGVTREMLERRIQRRIEVITPAQVVALRKVYNSLKDGMSAPGDWFDVTPPAADTEAAPTKTANVKMKLAHRKASKASQMPQDEPESDSLTLPPAAATTSIQGAPPRAITEATLNRIHKICQEKNIDEAMICQDADVYDLSELLEPEAVKIAEIIESKL